MLRVGSKEAFSEITAKFIRDLDTRKGVLLLVHQYFTSKMD